MKPDRIFAWELLLAAGILPGAGQADGAFKKTFAETDTLFRNPGQGWMAFARTPWNEPRLPCSVAYFRLNWEEVEPEEGKFAWKPIDEAADAWQKRGARVAFRIMTTNPHSEERTRRISTPQSSPQT